MSNPIIIDLHGRRLREVPERWDGPLDRRSACKLCALGEAPLAACQAAERALQAVTNNRRASCVTRRSMWEAVDAS